MTLTDEAIDDDQRGALQASVAELIAELSEAESTPTEFNPPPASFTAADVHFDSDTWVGYLESVQGWLRLDAPLPHTSPRDFALSLASSLGFVDPATALIADTESDLTDDALDKLRERVERSVALQRQFLDTLERDGTTSEAATSEWRDAWDDEPEAEIDTGPVRARADVWPIQDFSGRAARGQLNLSPSYQRGDVWPTGDSQKLIESILRGIPLPSVIILRPTDDDAPDEVVDGKQRLTAILRFIGKHPRAIEIVRAASEKHNEPNLQLLFNSNYPRFRTLWKNVTGQALTSLEERANYFPFKLRSNVKTMSGELAPLQGKYYTQIKSLRVQSVERRETVEALFEQTVEYKIPVIEYTQASRKQIHEVFNLYNKQGKHLNAEEIRNALYHDIDFNKALLVASGDNKEVDEVAPFLRQSWGQLGTLSGLLDGYSFGSARYRKTKVLSWLASILLSDLMTDGTPRKLSTARQIDDLLQRIDRSPNDPLRQHDTIRSALSVIQLGITAHSAIGEFWAPRFRDGRSGAKWQELQLVASVLAASIGAATVGEQVAESFDDGAELILEFTGDRRNGRPEKTQTATQWEFIARRTLSLLEIVGVDRFDADAALTRQFGHSCIPGLLAIAGPVQ